MQSDLKNCFVKISEDQNFATVVYYTGRMSLTNLMPHLAKYLNNRDQIDLLYIKYIDSEGEPTLYDVKKDSYSPWGSKK